MKTFSIKELELLTGTKSHTLRVWEKRYAAFKPLRTTGNNRLYSTGDLQKALIFSLLCECNNRISTLVNLTINELNEKSNKIVYPNQLQLKAVHDLIFSMYMLDTENFEQVFENAFHNWPAEQVMTNIIYPFLKRTGLLWKGKRLTEEHFAVTAIRSKIIFCIESLTSVSAGKKILLFLPGKGQLDLLLLYSSYIFKKNGLQVLYMGNDISDNNLRSAIIIKKPDYVFTFLTKGYGLNAEGLSSFMKEHILPALLIIAVNPEETIAIKNFANVITIPFDKDISLISDLHLVSGCFVAK